MLKEVVEQVMSLYSSAYYHVGTEINCLIIIMVLLGFMYYMKPRKTPYYIYLSTGIFFSALIAFLDIFMAAAAQEMHDAGAWVLTAAMMINTLLYCTCLTNMCLYVASLVSDARECFKGLEIAGRSVMCICAAFMCVVYAKHNGVRNDHGVISLDSYITAVTDLSFLVLACIAIFLFITRKKIVRVVFKGILFFLPFDALFLIIQRMQPRSLFVSAIAMLPLFGLYMFFHSNSFDEIMGCQNTYSMEVTFNQEIKDKKPFYFGMLRIPSLLHKSFSSDEADSVKPLIELVRQLELQYKDLYIFRRSAGEFYLIYETEYSGSSEKDMRQIGDILSEKLKEISQDEKFVMVGIEYTEGIRSINMMMDIIQQAVAKYSDQFGSCKKLLYKGRYDDLLQAYYLSELLEKLRDGRNYDNENIVCYAQPIYEVHSRQFRTAEALMRFYANGELVSPSVFIPIAEENSCIHFLTICMFHKVCKAIKDLMKQSEFDAISINVSVQEFSEENVAEEFLSIIHSYDVPVDKIRVELTESALATDSGMLAQNMKIMSDAGIKFYLDDFGTGYSSLERLTELPFSVVKFDKSLLYSALKNKKTDRLINGIVPIIKGDNFVALVEGVEDDAQYEYSVGTGFEYVQGYRWAKPVPIMELKDYFAAGDKEQEKS